MKHYFLTNNTFNEKWLSLSVVENKENMVYHYNDIVDKIYSLPLEDKVQLKDLLENNIADTRRAEIASNYKQSKEELKTGKLHFSSDIDDLKKVVFIDIGTHREVY